MDNNKFCYVIMPFSYTKSCAEREWTDIFGTLIEPAVEGAGLGYQCLRSEATTGNIVKKIVDSLYRANVVIADLTDRNPNVFYELGVRHTLKNRTILIAQRREDIPSDLLGYASHVYKWRTAKQKGAFASKIGQLLLQREENSWKLRALIEEMDLIAVLFNTASVQAEEAKDGKENLVAVSCPALDHFIATQYVHNSPFSAQARTLRALIAVAVGGRWEKAFMSHLRTMAETVKRNVQKLLAAYEAGDEIGALKIEDWPDWDWDNPNP
jgi:hypothetical protein